MANQNLSNAKTAKNDEFYTQYHDIEVEVNAYLEYDKDVFRGKTVLLPCDDPQVENNSGVFEYVLGGEQDTKLLNVRVFDEKIKRQVYKLQTDDAEMKGISNCPYCAIGHEATKTRIWKLSEMDADHVSAWSKGGATTIENCQMLCKTHNRAKGNR